MQIIHRVAVMQVLTEHSKEKLLSTFTEKKQMLERECSQLYFQLRKHEKEQQNPDVIEQFKKAIEKRKDNMKMIDFQITQVHTLPLGSEMKEKEIDALLTIRVGDDWHEKTAANTIVIKDGTVIEIRQR
ncbi:YlqD family protein [Bacillus mojavensis]|uniref:YlqD n=1 Tax=Bacillus mojavensis TaxID=72360 RepID=A0ABX6LW71_BACMO|nr:YlqD family protein [Bacillus mojavensis]MCY8103861.1 YlqD family protein [Bacillus mojavensis]MCY8480971.1 YlqD family protein [Bacillus mojavensis]MEC1670151.1 YlqD family protein [Bacillus mojavensis]MEC1678765.1 YlqD family protein [Bacillus mojavensis]MEC1711037.1 YlqD family protein [Bacillus mojavensis]